MNKKMLAVFLLIIILLTGCTSPAPEPLPEGQSNTAATPTPKPNIITPTTESEPVTLTIAVPGYESEPGIYSTSFIWEDEIAAFHEAQSEIRIETVIYPNDDTQLRLELISGEGPDLICTGEFGNLEVLTAMGCLVDLYPYLEQDADITKGDLWNIELLELDGKLVQIAPEFYLTTHYGTQDAYGEEPGWTLEECLARLESAESPQDILGNITGKAFVANFIRDYAKTHVDYENALCDFNTEEFRAILEVAKAIDFISDDPNVYSTLTQTQQEFFTVYPEVIYPCRISGLSEFTSFLNTTAGIPINLMGMPTSEGNGAYAAFPQPISVCSFTEHPQECWEFLKYLITNEYLLEDTTVFPLYLPYLETQIEDAIVEKVSRSQENPQSMLSSVALGQTVTPKFTEEEAELLHYLLDGGPSLYGYDPVVSPIVFEELEGYLLGQRTAEETIDLIENRVRIYLSEIQGG